MSIFPLTILVNFFFFNPILLGSSKILFSLLVRNHLEDCYKFFFCFYGSINCRQLKSKLYDLTIIDILHPCKSGLKIFSTGSNKCVRYNLEELPSIVIDAWIYLHYLQWSDCYPHLCHIHDVDEGWSVQQTKCHKDEYNGLNIVNYYNTSSLKLEFGFIYSRDLENPCPLANPETRKDQWFDDPMLYLIQILICTNHIVLDYNQTWFSGWYHQQTVGCKQIKAKVNGLNDGNSRSNLKNAIERSTQ